MRRLVTWLLFALLLLWPELAPAPSSGGSTGGSDFGGGGGGGGGGDIFALLELLFYLLYYGRFLFTTGPGFIVFLIIAAIVVFVYLTEKHKGHGGNRGETPALPMRGADLGGRKGGPYVVLLQIAFAAQGFRLREVFNQLARQNRTGSRAKLAELLRLCSEKLVVVAEHARYAALAEDGPATTLRDLETRFQKRAAEERGRYRRDTIRSEQGRVVVDQKDQLTNQTASGYVVVSLLAAFGRPLPVEAVPPTDPAKLRQLLEALRNLSDASNLYALEVIWTPAAEGDVLAESELLASFPALKGAAGARAAAFACTFCGQPFDAALPQCPSCGGANTGALS